MSIEKFRDIANLGFVIANELSNQALQSLQQKRHIAARRKVEIALEESSERLKLLLDINNAIVSNLELEALVHLIPARVRTAMQCDSVYLSMPDEERRKFVVRGLDFPESRGFLREGTVIEMLGSGVGDALLRRQVAPLRHRGEGTEPRRAAHHHGRGFPFGMLHPGVLGG